MSSGSSVSPVISQHSPEKEPAEYERETWEIYYRNWLCSYRGQGVPQFAVLKVENQESHSHWYKFSSSAKTQEWGEVAGGAVVSLVSALEAKDWRTRSSHVRGSEVDIPAQESEFTLSLFVFLCPYPPSPQQQIGWYPPRTGETESLQSVYWVMLISRDALAHTPRNRI